MTSDCTFDKEITFAGVKVLVVHKDDQVIYKLPTDLKMDDRKQREEIKNEIKSLYIKDNNVQQIDAPSESDILIKIKENKHEKHTMPLKRSTIGQKRNFEENQEDTKEKSLKSTRKYSRTGKYSKKKDNQKLSQQKQGKGIFFAYQPHQVPFGTTPQETDFSLSEIQNNNKTIKERFSNCLIQDHYFITNPNYQKPFTSIQDAIHRLLPYHVYHYPKLDLNVNIIPIELQDRRSIDIVRAQGRVFERYNSIVKRVNQKDRCSHLYIKREIVSDQKQNLQDGLIKIAKNCVQPQKK